MNLLAIDTSTETLSLAVCRGTGAQQQVWQHSAPGGANASTHLIGAALDLLAQARLTLGDLTAIAFGSGPGSFTGLRTACAVAQGLGFGANVPLLAIDSLLAVAQQARMVQAAPDEVLCVTALLDARMDEMYAADYRWDGRNWTTERDCELLRPQDLWGWLAKQSWTASHGVPVLAGNVFGVYAGRFEGADAGRPCHLALPTAVAMLQLAPFLIASGCAVPAEEALPRYIRDNVAKTTAQRMAEKVEKLAVDEKAGEAG